jgi:choice-of-anchor A domain-containing protein
LGVAGDYNVFVFDDFTALSSDIEGRLAAGGDISLTSYSVGDKLKDTSSLYTVVAGGDLTLTSGKIYGSAAVGGTSSITWASASTVKTSSAIDFTAAETYLTSVSSTLASISANGSAKISYGTLTLTGDGKSSMQVFTIDGSLLSDISAITIASIPDGATVIINVSGTSITMSNLGMSALSGIASNVLFNFYQAESLYLASIGFYGSILAVDAAITTEYGQINGTVIAESWSGPCQVNYLPFEGTFSVPEPGALVLLFSGLIGIAGLRRKIKK